MFGTVVLFAEKFCLNVVVHVHVILAGSGRIYHRHQVRFSLSFSASCWWQLLWPLILLCQVVVDGVRVEGATTIAAPVFAADGRPAGAVGITGPSERLTEARQAEAGPFVNATARALSRAAPGRAFD